MRLLKQLFDFYIFSNIHVALATFCLTKITLLTFKIADNEIPLFVFFATVLSYNFIRLYRSSEINSTWFQNWITDNKKQLYIVSIISLIGMLFYTFKLTSKTILYLTPFGVLTIFYILPFLNTSKSKVSLRALSGLKLFLIAFCWAGVTVLIPLINYEVGFSAEILIVFSQRFLFILAITIPFDIRDLNFDSDNLKTLPQIIGIENSKRLGLFLLMLFLGFNFLRKGLNSNQFSIELIIATISLVLLIRSTSNQNRYYSSFFVEAIPIVWFLLIWYNELV